MKITSLANNINCFLSLLVDFLLTSAAIRHKSTNLDGTCELCRAFCPSAACCTARAISDTDTSSLLNKNQPIMSFRSNLILERYRHFYVLHRRAKITWFLVDCEEDPGVQPEVGQIRMIGSRAVAELDTYWWWLGPGRDVSEDNIVYYLSNTDHHWSGSSQTSVISRDQAQPMYQATDWSNVNTPALWLAKVVTR